MHILSVDSRWTGLRNALAGLFCASLGSLDDQRTTSPTLTFRPEGHLPHRGYSYKLRHATLPSEHVCTENLTPFLKLLPCKSLSGIASLLNPHRLFDADWHGLGIHVRYVRDAGVEVRLSFQAVFDPVRYAGDKKRGTIIFGPFPRRMRLIDFRDGLQIGLCIQYSIAPLSGHAQLPSRAGFSSEHPMKTRRSSPRSQRL